MKSLLLLSIALLFSGQAHANTESEFIGFDGCYQMYLPNVMYPAVCLSGTAEEGINGAGVRLFSFRTNTDILDQCFVSEASGMTKNSFSFIYQGKEQLKMTVESVTDGRKAGEIKIGRYTMKYMQVADLTSKRLLEKAYRQKASGNCP